MAPLRVLISLASKDSTLKVGNVEKPELIFFMFSILDLENVPVISQADKIIDMFGQR